MVCKLSSVNKGPFQMIVQQNFAVDTSTYINDNKHAYVDISLRTYILVCVYIRSKSEPLKMCGTLFASYLLSVSDLCEYPNMCLYVFVCVCEVCAHVNSFVCNRPVPSYELI